MRKLIASFFISLDGVVEGPGPEEDFELAGWTMPYWDDDIGEFVQAGMMATDTLLLGRVTYQGFADAWPQREGEFADKFNNMPKYVVSSTLSDPDWTNTTVIDPSDIPAAVAKIREQHGGDIVVHGSAQLSQTLLEQDLVDELRLMVFPVVLGAGKRLFGETTDKKSLKLASSETVGDGVQILVYERA
jgi:dihydrofolate reductase